MWWLILRIGEQMRVADSPIKNCKSLLRNVIIKQLSGDRIGWSVFMIRRQFRIQFLYR
jgi:hypothetical protein